MKPQPPPLSTVAVRPAGAADLAAIADIYNEAVLHSTATFDTEPRTLEEQGRWLREHGHPYAVVVAVHAGSVVGFASLSRFHSRPAYLFTAEDSVYVREDLRGNGIGLRLLGRLVELAAENGFHSVVARIGGDNPASVRLHRRLGFRRVGVEREVGQKFGRWLGVTVMQKTVAEPTDRIRT